MTATELEAQRAKLFATYTEDCYGRLNDLSDAGLDKLARYAAQHLVPLLPDERDAPILDLGCGTGGFLLAAHRAGYEKLAGLDVSPSQVEFCRRRLGFDDVECVGGVEALSRPGSRFAAIVVADVLEHLTKAEALLLPRLAFDRLTPGGRFIVRVPNMSNPLNLRTRYTDLTHEVGFTVESLAQLLRNAGFEVGEIRGEYTLDPRWHVRLVFDRLLWRAFRAFVRRTLHLPFPIERGKNLLAVGIRPRTPALAGGGDDA